MNFGRSVTGDLRFFRVLQDMGKVLYLSLTMKVHNLIKNRSEYQFRRRIADGDIEPVTITPIKPRKG